MIASPPPGLPSQLPFLGLLEYLQPVDIAVSGLPEPSERVCLIGSILDFKVGEEESSCMGGILCLTMQLQKGRLLCLDAG